MHDDQEKIAWTLILIHSIIVFVHSTKRAKNEDVKIKMINTHGMKLRKRTMERKTDGEEKYGESDFINLNACKQKFLDLKHETIWTWGASDFKSNKSCKNIHRLCNCSLDYKIITFL